MSAKALVRDGLLSVLALLLVACGPPSTAVQAAPARPAQLATTPAPPASPDLAPAPSIIPEVAQTPLVEATPVPPTAQPDSYLVGFGGFAAGTYPVHLHRVCSGRQGYHLAYLPDLYASSAGTGGIAVPSGDFGHGWCVVVYANRAATVVAAYRPI